MINMDNINVTILEDGTIKVETDEVGQANHMNAEKFLAFMARLAGGQTETIRKPHSHGQHTHVHGHSHSH